jgi:flagellar hook-length control protein FliK
MAALQALLAPQQAGQTALAAMPAAQPNVVASAGSIAGNAAAAQAVGAGAQPGASGSVRVTASASTDTSQAAGEPTLASQVGGTIRWLVKNQDQSAELQLHPESLGRVQVSLKVEGTVVHAKVWASEASTVPVLQDHRASLEASLKSQGLTLGSFDLQHGHRQQQEPPPTPSEPASATPVSLALPRAGQESPVSLANTMSHTSRIEYVA